MASDVELAAEMHRESPPSLAARWLRLRFLFATGNVLFAVLYRVSRLRMPRPLWRLVWSLAWALRAPEEQEREARHVFWAKHPLLPRDAQLASDEANAAWVARESILDGDA